VSVWAVPNGMELTREAESSIPKILDGAVGSRAPTVLEALLQFEAAHPHDEPHYYLSIVATHDDHRGRGIGESLLARNLETVDARHFPAYLESSNPKNLARYERLGFRPREQFALPDGGPTVTTMWRVAR
jgi:GNAT superfamily N-acetyltransferase